MNICPKFGDTECTGCCQGSGTLCDNHGREDEKVILLQSAGNGTSCVARCTRKICILCPVCSGLGRLYESMGSRPGLDCPNCQATGKLHYCSSMKLRSNC